MALSLGKKIGPLPLWGWGVAGVGGYVVYKRVKGNVAAPGSKAGLPTQAGGKRPKPKRGRYRY